MTPITHFFMHRLPPAASAEFTAPFQCTPLQHFHWTLHFLRSPLKTLVSLLEASECTPPASSSPKKAHLVLRAPPGPPLATPPRRELGLPKCFCSCSLCLSYGEGDGERETQRNFNINCLFIDTIENINMRNLCETEERDLMCV